MITLGPTANLFVTKLANAIGTSESNLIRGLQDGRFASGLLSLWLDQRDGLNRVPDGNSGCLFEKGGQYYRLRVGTDRIALSPSVTRGAGRRFTKDSQARENARLAGFILAFCNEMPNPKTWLVDLQDAKAMIQAGCISQSWSGASSAVQSYLESHATSQPSCP